MRLRFLPLIIALATGPVSMVFAADTAAPKPADAAPGAAAPAKENAERMPQGFSEPNLKGPKDSGGRISSHLIKDAPLATDYVMGKTDAPLIMVEYASLSCPHCAHFSTTVMPDIQKRYIDTGKMRYILRQFPLNEPALKGAMLVDCIGEQNPEKYYVFNKVLFDAQNKWAFDANYMSGLETIATVGGLTKDQFQNCVTPTEREVKLLKQKKAAEEELRVPHTPYVVIGDEAFEGDRSFENIAKFIDRKLAELAQAKAAQ